ncbi:hypothetical protein Tco_0875301 [Tanacetum coccineum]|uniref:Uncharacterized protein n=1 Tax=Tanacetum coccineum TaxID=301880 RepID=A0ABQ5BP80_9ASTR
MFHDQGSNKEDPWRQQQVIEGCRDKEKKGFHVLVFQTEADSVLDHTLLAGVRGHVDSARHKTQVWEILLLHQIRSIFRFSSSVITTLEPTEVRRSREGKLLGFQAQESFFRIMLHGGYFEYWKAGLVVVYPTKEIQRNVIVRGMLILDEFLTEEIYATDDFKEYETVFLNVVVPMNQPQPVVSTQGTHGSIRRAHRTPTVSTAKKTDELKDDEMGSLETRIEQMQTSIPTTPRSPRINLSSNKDITQELTDTVLVLTTTTSKDPHSKRRITTETIIEDRDAFQAEALALISNEFNAQTPKIIEELFMNYVKNNVIHVHPTTTTSTETTSSVNLQQLDDAFHSRGHDDHQEDDAPPEGEKRVKILRRLKAQSMQEELDAWVEETVIDEDEVIPKDETPELITKLQNVDGYVVTIFNRTRIEVTLKDMLSNQFKNAEEYAYHLEQATDFMENQIVWESIQEDIRRPVPKPLVFFRPQRNPNEPPRYFYNKDLFFLMNKNTKEKKYIPSLHKIYAERFPKADLEEKMNLWIRKEFNNFNEVARLTIQH